MLANTKQEGRKQMRKTWKPIAAGAIDIISGILGGLGITLLITNLIYRGFSWIDIETIIFVCFLSIPCLSLAGGISAILRKRWRLALAGAASAFMSLAITCFAPQVIMGSEYWWAGYAHKVIPRIVIATFAIPILVGWAPIVLTALSKNEFK